MKQKNMTKYSLPVYVSVNNDIHRNTKIQFSVEEMYLRKFADWERPYILHTCKSTYLCRSGEEIVSQLTETIHKNVRNALLLSEYSGPIPCIFEESSVI